MAVPSLPEISTREEARKARQRFYFTGKPCRAGHIDKRYVVNYRCVQCSLDERDYHTAWARSYRRDNRESLEAARRQRKYGITLAEYKALYAAQGGKCLLCREWRPMFPGAHAKGLNIDHCHKTGKIRGMLCHTCNLGLGHFKDDPDRLRRAVNYLEGRIVVGGDALTKADSLAS